MAVAVIVIPIRSDQAVLRGTVSLLDRDATDKDRAVTGDFGVAVEPNSLRISQETDGRTLVAAPAGWRWGLLIGQFEQRALFQAAARVGLFDLDRFGWASLSEIVQCECGDSWRMTSSASKRRASTGTRFSTRVVSVESCA